MAHLLRGIELVSPRLGVLAILPESALHSDLDSRVRAHLSADYRIEILRELPNSTFKGARANSVAIRLSRGTSTSVPAQCNSDAIKRVVAISRGGLPVYEAKISRRGVPFIHTTNISDVAASQGVDCCPRVRPIQRAQVSGAMILLPRVGLPYESYLWPVSLRSKVQLSDCVIALLFQNMSEARCFGAELRKNIGFLQGAYRGTGARYVSVARLRDVLQRLGAIGMEVPGLNKDARRFAVGCA